MFSEIDKNFEGKVYIPFQIVTENSCQVSEKKDTCLTHDLNAVLQNVVSGNEGFYP